jgi:hypothetical protein
MKLKKLQRQYYPFRGLLKATLLACVLLLSSFGQQQTTEYKLKAAFIYNFLQYIEWEPQSSNNEFVIAIVGSSPISQPLEDIARLKSGKDRKITIKYFNDADDIGACHILFIPETSPVPLNTILTKVPKGALTVSERDGYALRGTAINFIIVNNKLKFESNLRALSAAGLKASSQLLKLAIIVAGT